LHATRAQTSARTSEQYACGLFEHSPVSLWVEDFTGIKRLRPRRLMAVARLFPWHRRAP